MNLERDFMRLFVVRSAADDAVARPVQERRSMLGTSATETPCRACPDLITLKEKVRNIEEDNKTRDADIKTLLEFKAGINMLLSLSIGGGARSVITLILTIVNLLTK